ncbi:MAG: hypothetical protein JWQ83_1149 [Lacunisphaera sp.]|nr:hypothetical protein [Lacunisphaera sp.]
MKVTNHDRKQRELKLAIQSWLRGHYPEGIEIAKAAVLEEWSVVWLLIGDRTAMKIEGLLVGDPLNHDGDLVRTSPVAMFDREHRWVRTVNTLYRLGQQRGDEIGFEVKL